MKSTRREFFTTLSAAGVAAAPAVLLSRPRVARARPRKLAVRLSKLPALARVGGWTVVSLRKWKVLFVRTSDKEVRAFTPYCTHRKCLVGYDAPRRRLACGCHGSKFDLNGTVLNGPAPRDLPRYPCWLRGDRVIVQVPG